jgi:hypothetical protein
LLLPFKDLPASILHSGGIGNNFRWMRVNKLTMQHKADVPWGVFALA